MDLRISKYIWITDILLSTHGVFRLFRRFFNVVIFEIPNVLTGTLTGREAWERRGAQYESKGKMGPFDDRNQDFSKLKTLDSFHVRPGVEREAIWLEWTIFDRIWSGFFSSYFFLYKPESQGSGGGDVAVPSIDVLVGSLRKALVPFYPFAGRLIKESAASQRRLHCNDEGALFLHKQYHGVVTDVIDEELFRPNELISGLHEYDPLAEVLPAPGLPALIIQVTDFRCGTRCLSTSWSHGVADGFSGAHFLQSWAEISRGEAISLLPVIDRSLMQPREPLPVYPEGVAPRFLNAVKQEYKGWGKEETPISDEEMGCKTIKVSRKKLEQLKAEALESSHDRNLNVSTLDCLSAFLWRTITHHRNCHPHELTRYESFVNIRSRKGLTAGFFGNGLLIVSISMKVEDLLSQPLGEVAASIHDTIASIDEELVQSWIDFATAKPLGPGAMGDEPFRPGDPLANLRRTVTSWQNRFPFYNLDFGTGRPASIVRNGFRMVPFNLGFCFGLPTPTTDSSGDLAMSLFLEKQVLEKLSSHF